MKMKFYQTGISVFFIILSLTLHGVAGLSFFAGVSPPAPVAGFLNDDINPASGTVLLWGGTGSAAMDYSRRSIALDFGGVRPVKSVKLRDSDNTSRVTATDYSLWYSSDNTNYTAITGWYLTEEFLDGRLVHTFTGFDVNARYIKINTGVDTKAGYTFILQKLQEDVWSFPLKISDFGITLHSDGDRLFPVSANKTGIPAADAEVIVRSEMEEIFTAGFKTLKMGIGTDVLNWNSSTGSSRAWRLDDPDWPLSPETWTKYAVLHGTAQTAQSFFDHNMDPIRIAAEQARKNGMRFFLSWRIADTHFTADPANHPLTEKFYMEHEFGSNSSLSVAIKHSGSSPVPGYSPRFNTLMNFDLEHVRTHRLNIICEALDRYHDTIDGFELEFTRSVALFPLGTGAEKTELVTEFLQDVREYINDMQSSSNKLWFGLRVPWDQSLAFSQGLDVEKQIRDRRIDYIVSSMIMSISHDMDIRNWIAIGQPNHTADPGVAFYAGLPARKPNGWTFPRTFINPDSYTVGQIAENAQLLGAALGFFDMGVEGIELYNFAGSVASAAGRTRLKQLTDILTKNVNVSSHEKIMAVTPVYAVGYEGRLEYAKKLPAEFRSNGSLWINSADGKLVKSETDFHEFRLFVIGRETMGADEVWFLRLGVRLAADQDTDDLSFKIILNDSDVLLDGTPPHIVEMATRLAAPAPTHYMVIPVPRDFLLKNSDFNKLTILRNTSVQTIGDVRVQEIQLGTFLH
ncbi:MAG: discoidin domain-containing protein [Kiritimatiellales bacterium]